jgi:Ca2+-binding EF-hand superfamily protein
MPPSKLDELRKLFVKMDVDDSGTVSLAEFKKAMSLHPEIPQARIEQMFHVRQAHKTAAARLPPMRIRVCSRSDSRVRASSACPCGCSLFQDMDIDHSGEVEYSEFIAATQSAQKHSTASMMAAFNTLDTDKDGYITRQDLVIALDHQMDNKVHPPRSAPDGCALARVPPSPRAALDACRPLKSSTSCSDTSSHLNPRPARSLTRCSNTRTRRAASTSRRSKRRSSAAPRTRKQVPTKSSRSSRLRQKRSSELSRRLGARAPSATSLHVRCRMVGGSEASGWAATRRLLLPVVA